MQVFYFLNGCWPVSILMLSFEWKILNFGPFCGLHPCPVVDFTRLGSVQLAGGLGYYGNEDTIFELEYVIFIDKIFIIDAYYAQCKI